MSESETIVALAEEYLACRRSLGYQLRRQGQMLLDFARYVDGLGYRGPITTGLVLQWATLPQNASPAYLAQRVSVVRCFAKHRSAFDPHTQVPPSGTLGRSRHRVQPYVFSQEEIVALIREARHFSPKHGLRPRTYATLFGLLACAGLRISEALNLTQDHVDLNRGILTVHKSKFNKSRLVPLHPSTIRVLRSYARFRNRYLETPARNTFFLSERGTPLVYSTVKNAFSTLRRRLGWTSHHGARLPRIYDLRHTFVCRRLQQWYEDGVDVAHAIFALSTYLGHVKATDTYWYVTAIPELLAAAAVRFERFGQPEGDTQ